jgi:hypothetical protein
VHTRRCASAITIRHQRLWRIESLSPFGIEQRQRAKQLITRLDVQGRLRKLS